MTEERRRHPRFDILAQIRVKRGRVNYIMNVENVSVTGMFVSTAGLKKIPAFRIGQTLELDLFNPEILTNIRVQGKIVRFIDGKDSGYKGFGVQFIELDDNVRSRLDTLVDLAVQGSIHPPPLPR
jgi:PilZ domain-containing protein